MMEIAQTYLGNINQDPNLTRSIAQQTCLEVSLQDSDRAKGRIHACTNSGVALGIIKGRDRILQAGDLYRTNSEKLVLIHIQEQEVLVLDFDRVDSQVTMTKLVNLGHTLGNHHYPIVVKDSRIYVQLVTDKSILESLINNLQIPNLKLSYQSGDRQLEFSKHTH